MSSRDRSRPDRGALPEGAITAIEAQRRRPGRRSNVFVDGPYAFSATSEQAASLRVGQAISASETSQLLSDDELARCREAAMRFLSARPRSEREVRQRLARHGYPTELVDPVIERLRGQNLVNDGEFAQFWVEQRQAHRPRGARLLKQELRQKGLSVDVATEALSDSGNEAENAYRAAAKRAVTLRALDEFTFRRRLGAFLQRRGFGYQTSAAAVSRLWAETRADT